MQEALTLCSTFLALGMHSKNPPRLCPQGRKILEERQKMSDESYPDYRMAGSPPGRLSRGEVYSLHRERGRAHGTWRGWGGHLWLPGGADGVRAPEAGGLGDEGGGGGEEGVGGGGEEGWGEGEGWGRRGEGKGRKRKKVNELSRCYILSNAIM